MSDETTMPFDFPKDVQHIINVTKSYDGGAIALDDLSLKKLNTRFNLIYN